jgi:hypothetical protein
MAVEFGASSELERQEQGSLEEGLLKPYLAKASENSP